MSNIKKKILIVEDEPAIADALIYAIEKEGFCAIRQGTIGGANDEFQKNTFDAIVLDIGLPDGSGFDFCKKIRETSCIPILFLTARSDEVDKIIGLELGADDYVTKPFSPREVTARLKAIFRRVPGSSTSPGPSKYPIEVDEALRKVTCNNKNLDLSRYEFGILQLLLKRPGQVYSREQIMNSVWEEPDMSLSRTVDTHVKTMRAKIKAISPNEEFLVTHRGIGYSLKEI